MRLKTKLQLTLKKSLKKEIVLLKLHQLWLTQANMKTSPGQLDPTFTKLNHNGFMYKKNQTANLGLTTEIIAENFNQDVVT